MRERDRERERGVYVDWIHGADCFVYFTLWETFISRNQTAIDYNAMPSYRLDTETVVILTVHSSSRRGTATFRTSLKPVNCPC